MKKKVISLVVLSTLSMSAHAMTIKQADEGVAIAEHDYSEALESYKSAAYEKGSAVQNSGFEKMLSSAGAARAQAYADQRAAVQEAQNKQDTADKAQAIQERNNRINNPGMAHRLNTGVQTPNVVSHVTASQRPSASYDTMTPGITKESNPAGHPTHQIAPATHLDSSTADRQAAKTAAKAAMAQHKAELSNYGTKQSGTASYSEPAHAVSYSGTSTRPNTGATNTMQSGIKNDPTGQPTNQQSPDMGKNLAKANYARTEQQAVALADAQAQHAKDVANYGVKRTGTATYSEQPHTITYSGVTTRPDTGATINVAANTLKPDTNVQVTDRTTGRKSVVKASTLTPSTQVNVPFHGAFQHVGKGGYSHETTTSHGDHGTGTGADNAHDHAFGGHDGAGGGFHM